MTRLTLRPWRGAGGPKWTFAKSMHETDSRNRFHHGNTETTENNKQFVGCSVFTSVPSVSPW